MCCPVRGALPEERDDPALVEVRTEQGLLLFRYDPRTERIFIKRPRHAKVYAVSLSFYRSCGDVISEER